MTLRPPPAIRTLLAPGGTLRAVINIGNAMLAQRKDETADPTGLSVDIARALARGLELPLAFHVVPSAAKAVDAVKSGEGDVGFFAIDPARSHGLAFTGPYLLLEGIYLVRQESPIGDRDAVDQPGHKVVVAAASAYDLFLTRTLKHAQIRRVATSAEVAEDFLASGATVAAGIRRQIEDDCRRLRGLRILPDPFMQIEQAMGVASSRGQDAASYVRAFVEQIKSDGLVGELVLRHHLSGVRVAPPG
jgi:ABC-type amino acid transport substrate-binding protein